MIKIVKSYAYLYKGKEYPVEITYKRQRNIYFRFRDGKVFISAPRLATKSMVFESLKKLENRVFKFDKKVLENFIDLNNNLIYIFGEQIPLVIDDSNCVDGSGFHVKSIDSINTFLKSILLGYVKERTLYYEKIMNISVPYKVRVKNMTSRHGSNSYSTHAISYQTKLVHFDRKIIDSVIVHELTHEFQRNHSDKFYKILLQYFPSYHECHRKLNKGIVK